MLHIRKPKSNLIAFNGNENISLGDIVFHEGADVQIDNRYDAPLFRLSTNVRFNTFNNFKVYDPETGNLNYKHFTGGFNINTFTEYQSSPNSEQIVPFLIKGVVANDSSIKYGCKVKIVRNEIPYENSTHGFGGYVSADMFMENNDERSVTTNSSVNIDGIKEVIPTKVINELGLYHDTNIIWQNEPIYLESDGGYEVYSKQTYSNTIVERVVGDIFTFKQDIKIVKDSDTVLKKIYYRNDISGLWLLDVDKRIIDRWNELEIGKGFTIRLVIATSKWNSFKALTPIAPALIDSLYFRKTMSYEQISISEDKTTVTYKFDAPCLVSAYLNNVLVVDKLLSTVDGEITINFGKDLYTGNNVELRTFTYNETVLYNSYVIDYADSTPPPMVEANRFIINKIYGTGGEAGSYAVAKRNDIEIGRVLITGSLEFIMQLNNGVTLITGDLVELFAEDTVGNKSESELYEVEVSVTTDGNFTQTLGNDTLIARVTI